MIVTIPIFRSFLSTHHAMAAGIPKSLSVNIYFGLAVQISARAAIAA
ncbi:hypothetical protein MRS76_00225 [Rhizobiaceae bacterium n13]|uniref:Uncharacterized protein n=1 Tax=Ferirhizobium litorale TaxID=2927786 RepID=A0AAE3TZR4_9HYPH|nr:hypothetical protein [Fererhizobium litorale]MDI7860366.1 hypothetical protein [Fererhizobium litorale]MDI7920501.1 hypothetical protein [Fererhizobium litorale]